MGGVPTHHPNSAVRRRPQGPSQRHPPSARAARELLRTVRADPQCGGREAPRGRPVGVLRLERDHAGWWTGDAVAGRAAGQSHNQKALNAGYDLLEAKCNRCQRISLFSLRGLKRTPSTPIWKLEPALYCEPSFVCPRALLHCKFSDPVGVIATVGEQH